MAPYPDGGIQRVNCGRKVGYRGSEMRNDLNSFPHEVDENFVTGVVNLEGITCLK